MNLLSKAKSLKDIVKRHDYNEDFEISGIGKITKTPRNPSNILCLDLSNLV